MNEEEMKSQLVEYLDWYHREDVQYEIVKSLFNRETTFYDVYQDKMCRNWRVHNVPSFKELFQFMGCRKRPYNFYYSMAKYKQGIPYQDLKRPKGANYEWELNHWKEIQTFDMLIDFDAEWNMSDKIKQNVIDVSNLLSEVPHSIRFSGSGYHIVIPGEYMPKGLNYDHDLELKNSYYCLLADLLNALKRNYYGKIDLSCADHRRVAKIPYSLSNYFGESYVCWPFFKHQEILDMKAPQMFTTSYILSSCGSIRNRGVPILNLEKVNESDPSAAMRKVCKELLGKKWDKYEKLINSKL
jgi:hypothetical protein